MSVRPHTQWHAIEAVPLDVHTPRQTTSDVVLGVRNQLELEGDHFVRNESLICQKILTESLIWLAFDLLLNGGGGFFGTVRGKAVAMKISLFSFLSF